MIGHHHKHNEKEAGYPKNFKEKRPALDQGNYLYIPDVKSL